MLGIGHIACHPAADAHPPQAASNETLHTQPAIPFTLHICPTLEPEPEPPARFILNYKILICAAPTSLMAQPPVHQPSISPCACAGLPHTAFPEVQLCVCIPKRHVLAVRPGSPRHACHALQAFLD